MRSAIVTATLVLATALTAHGAPQEQQYHPVPVPSTQGKPATPPSGMMSMADCQQMMSMRDKMMSEMKAADQRLDQLVTRMNAATGPAKVDAVAAVVTEMVAQRRNMREQMMSMQSNMMGHMMQHMQTGNMDCPMMKDMMMKKPGGQQPR